MSFRKVLFWLHLVAGLIAGLSIAVMCFTGVVLAFEKQLVAWSERDARLVATPAAGTPRLSLDELTRRVREAKPNARPSGLTVSADPAAAVVFVFGRDGVLYANPYTGEIRSPASTRVHDFMHVMEDWHRFLALTGEQRPIGKIVNGVCNLAFCVLAVTGVYLWWPRTWSRRGLRAIVLFNWSLSGKARDFNWHNVIGLWSAPILIVLTLTAVPISFRWGNNLVYRLAGEAPPAQAGPPPSALPPVELPLPPAGARPISRDAQLAAIQGAFPTWEQVTLRLGPPGRGGAPAPAGQRTNSTAAETQPLTFTIKTPDAWPRTATTTAVLNPFTGELLRREAFTDHSAGRQLRIWTRFLHTGEALGWIGQAIAGLASLGGCFLVYTGVALSWRRLLRFRRRNALPPVSEPELASESSTAKSAHR